MVLPKRKANRIPGYDYGQNGAYFITICTRNRQQILSKISIRCLTGGLVEAYPKLLPYGQIADKYVGQMNSFYSHLSVDRYIIMPDHVHLLIRIHRPLLHVASRKDDVRISEIASFVGTFKRFCNKEFGFNIWQARFYDHVIRNQQDYDEIWQYIENNPWNWVIKHRGYE